LDLNISLEEELSPRRPRFATLACTLTQQLDDAHVSIYSQGSAQTIFTPRPRPFGRLVPLRSLREEIVVTDGLIFGSDPSCHIRFPLIPVSVKSIVKFSFVTIEFLRNLSGWLLI